MKWVSFILAVYTLVLTLRPCCGDDNCTDSDNCQTELVDNHDKDNHQNNGHKGSCSPFFTCGNCVGFTLTTVHFSLPPQTDITPDLVTMYHCNFLSGFEMPIWQPPQIR
ncbi:DUF6660 family protein [Maribacter polysaccharolyticus]|uniref:DUF6660 family protein n=1 Tax=Maribacter polysaccharolyticus TaxID=3020831 RepID=UPI003B83729E